MVKGRGEEEVLFRRGGFARFDGALSHFFGADVGGGGGIAVFSK